MVASAQVWHFLGRLLHRLDSNGCEAWQVLAADVQWSSVGKGGSMSDEQLLERVVLDPKVMTGKPVIKGTRLTVDYILNLLAHGSSTEEIVDEYQGLTVEDVQACLLFATRSLGDTSFMPLAAEFR
jgi:uncharacterized protein (DUF433 family)